MGWLKWILAYLFDCVHPHTTWPRRNATGLVYICCVDCGRELPYSLKYMAIITRVGQNRKAWRTGSIATVSRVLISVILLFNSGRAAAQTSNDSANESGVSAHTPSAARHFESRLLLPIRRPGLYAGAGSYRLSVTPAAAEVRFRTNSTNAI
jgi:hypothetical protein